jgi:hypothetical protein
MNEPRLAEELGNQKEATNSSRKTHRSRGENQLVKCGARPFQPTLEGVARRHLLVIFGVIAGLKGGRP